MDTRVLSDAMAFSGLLVLAGCGGSSEGGEDFKLTILHINDHHSNLDAVSATIKLKTGAGPERENVAVQLGGFPRVTSAIEALSAGRSNVLKLHAGDAITGTLYYTLEEGKADAELMNTVCFDAMAIGNHEFDAGDAGLKQFADYLWADSACKTPLLSANVSPRAGSPLGSSTVVPSQVITREGEKIGIVGLTVAAKTQGSSRPDAGTMLLDEVASAQREIDRLRTQGVNKIVVLSHLGYEREVALAAELSGVDVIVGGDSHSLLGDDSLQDFGLSPVGAYPTVASSKDGDKVCVVQVWQYSAVVGELDVTFDSAGRVKDCAGQPHVLIGESFGDRPEAALAAIRADIATQPALRITPESAQALAVLEPYREALVAFGSEGVAVANGNLCLRRVPGTVRDGSRSRLAGCNDDPHVIAHGGDVQQVVADAFLYQGKRYGGADLSLQNGGGVRVDVANGPVTVGAVYTVLPFRNTLVTLTMTGAEVKAAVEDAMTSVASGNTGSYPYAGGFRWAVDLNRPAGDRLSQLAVRDDQGLWKPLDATATYRVITNDFIADGQDGYTTLGTIKGERREDTFLAYADAFLQYVLEVPVLVRPASSEFSTQVFIDTP